MITFNYKNKTYTIKNTGTSEHPYLMSKVPYMLESNKTTGAFISPRKHFKDIEYTVTGRKTSATPYLMNEFLWWIGATDVRIDGVYAEKPQPKTKALPVKKPTARIDPEREGSIKEGEIFSTEKYGDLKVVERYNSFYMVVQFLNTGHELVVSSEDLISGKLIDTSVIDDYKGDDLPWK